jgi:predicted permease
MSVVAVGYVLQRSLAVDVRSISRVALYALSPCLVFSSLVSSNLDSLELLRVFGFVLTVMACMGALSTVVARMLRLNQSQQSAFLLTTIFGNTGNFGLPVLLFAFGEAGLQLGLIYFVTTAFLNNSLGVFIASRGKAGVKASLRAVLGMPVFYSTILALLFNRVGVSVPEWILKSTKLLGDAAIPTTELLLGMQLARTSLRRDLRLAAVASFLALVASAGLSFPLSGLWRLQGLMRKVCIVETATPTAVTTTVLATEFDTEPGFVTSVVLMTTLASIVTVTLLLTLLA